MIPQLLNEVKQGNYYMCIHNGYPGFSYGCPQNPIVLDYDEANKVNDFLMKKLNYDLLNDFESEKSYDLVLPDNISEILQMSVVTIARPISIFYENDVEKEKAEKTKQELLRRVFDG